jgi:N-acetylmuramoyl-L-alanine amidase
MGYGISTKGRLTSNGKPVDYIESRYIGGGFPSTPRIAVIHFTYGGTARSSAEWFRTPRPNGSSAHIVIERDGSVIQCVPLDRIAWHAGKSRWKDLVGLNNHSIGIELANWGYLKRSGEGWACWTGKPVHGPVLAIHKNGNPDGSTAPIGWEAYPDAQFNAAAAIVSALTTAYGVDEIVGHDDIAPTRKWDPGPAFDMTSFRDRVFGGRADTGDIRLTVNVASGLNLRSGPGTSFGVVALLADGTLVEPLATEQNWVQVTVLDSQGNPDRTGWVHGHYLSS